MNKSDVTVRYADLGEDVIYAVHSTPAGDLLVLNTRPVTNLNQDAPGQDGGD